MIDFQRKILGDDVRNKALHAALKKVIRPGMVVIDIGAGTGYLSFLARMLGAKECILIDDSPAMHLAKKLAKENHITGCRFLQSHSTDVELPACADLILSETLGNFALEEHLLENLMDAKRFLKPGGAMLPCSLKQFVAPILHENALAEIDIWRTIPGQLNFDAVRSVALQNLYVETVKTSDLLHGVKGERCWDSIDVREHERSVRQGKVEWQITAATTIYAFAAWWECALAPGVILSTSPQAPETHWEQVILPILTPLSCKKGDLLQLHLTSDTRYNIGLRVQWEVSLRRKGNVIAREKMDSLRGEFPE